MTPSNWQYTGLHSYPSETLFAMFVFISWRAVVLAPALQDHVCCHILLVTRQREAPKLLVDLIVFWLLYFIIESSCTCPGFSRWYSSRNQPVFHWGQSVALQSPQSTHKNTRRVLPCMFVQVLWFALEQEWLCLKCRFNLHIGLWFDWWCLLFYFHPAHVPSRRQ